MIGLFWLIVVFADMLVRLTLTRRIILSDSENHSIKLTRKDLCSARKVVLVNGYVLGGPGRMNRLNDLEQSRTSWNRWSWHE